MRKFIALIVAALFIFCAAPVMAQDSPNAMIVTLYSTAAGASTTFGSTSVTTALYGTPYGLLQPAANKAYRLFGSVGYTVYATYAASGSTDGIRWAIQVSADGKNWQLLRTSGEVANSAYFDYTSETAKTKTEYFVGSTFGAIPYWRLYKAKAATNTTYGNLKVVVVGMGAQ